MNITFCSCTQCGKIVDLATKDLDYTQSNPHNYYWDGPGRCFGYLKVPSTKEAWETQEGRKYPHEISV